MKLETVVVKTEAGPVVINKSDFDAKKHSLETKQVKKAKKAKAE
jgi:hypothetical protein